jgi:hypothetical protein
MGKENFKEYDRSYHPPETMQMDYCSAVLGVVLKNHPRAEELFQGIRDCALLPGVKDTFITLEKKAPESQP